MAPLEVLNAPQKKKKKLPAASLEGVREGKKLEGIEGEPNQLGK